MKFKENSFVICNIQKKINNNIVGIDNIMGFKIDDYVYDVINKKLYPIMPAVINFNNIDDGIYANILGFPFENSEAIVSEEVFNGEYFSKYKKQYDLHDRNYRRNDSDQIYIDLSSPKRKIIKLPSRKF